MSIPELSDNDSLADIDYSAEIDAADPKLLRNQVSSTDGSIVIVAGFGCSLVLGYAFGPASLAITLTLRTPIGDVTLANTDLNPHKPCATVGGAISRFKARAKVCFNFHTREITATGDICVPVAGCKRGSTKIHV